MFLEDDLRDGKGRPLREPVYHNGSVLLDKQGRIRTVRVHVSPKDRLAVAQDTLDRTGAPRQTTTKLEIGDGLPSISFVRPNHPKPSALGVPEQKPSASTEPNGHDHEAQEIPPPVVH